MTENAHVGHLVFQNEAKNISSQDFVMMAFANLRSLSIIPFVQEGQQKFFAES